MGVCHGEIIWVMCDNCDEKEELQASDEELFQNPNLFYWEEKKLKELGWIFEKDRAFCSNQCKKEYEEM